MAYPSEMQDRFIVRMPEGLREAIRAAAEANGRSMNAEIVARLRGPTGPSRDEIAMRAMAAIICQPNLEGYDPQIVAKWAYEYADALLVVAKGGQ